MHNFRFYFYLVALIFLASCSSNDNKEILKYTTDSTLGIVRINVKEISSKSSADKLLKEKKNLTDQEKLLLQIVEKPKDAGIQENNPIYILVDKDSKQNSVVYKCLLSITDQKKFQESLTKLTGSTVKINDKNLIFINNQLIGGIQKEKAVLIQKNEPLTSILNYENNFTTTINEKDIQDFWATQGTSDKHIKEQINKSLQKNYDLSAYANIGNISSYYSNGYIESLAVYKLLKNSGYGINMVFNKGNFEVDTRSMFNSEMDKVIPIYYNKHKVNYDLAKNIDIDNSKYFTVGFFSLDFLKFIIKEAGLEATVNNYLQYSGNNLEDITSVFTGHFAYAEVKNPSNKNEEDYYDFPSVALVLEFNKKNENTLQSILKGPLFENSKYQIQDDKIIFSKDNKILNDFKNKVSPKNSKLNKESGLVSYSWSDGSFSNASGNNGFKIEDVINTIKVKEGNFQSSLKVNVAQKDNNSLYYFLLGSND